MKNSMNIGMVTLLVLFASCRSVKKESMISDEQKIELTLSDVTAPMAGGNPASTSPVVYIYKMKEDYSQQVPVMMDESRSRIVSYPHPADLLSGDELRLPTPLEQGYWLDNKGIGPNVAFLTYTYEVYSTLPTAPSMEDLMANIADKYPLLEIHACGRRADYKDIVSELNEKISEGILQK